MTATLVFTGWARRDGSLVPPAEEPEELIAAWVHAGCTYRALFVTMDEEEVGCLREAAEQHGLYPIFQGEIT